MSVNQVLLYRYIYIATFEAGHSWLLDTSDVVFKVRDSLILSK